MKKKYEWWVSHRRALKKMMLMTKLTTFLVLVFSVNVVASVYSQNTKLNLDMEQTSIKEVLQQIESQSDFRFIYENEKMNMDKKVSIRMNNESVDQVLKKLFEGEGISFTITSNKLIIIKPSDELKANENLAQQQQTISGKVTDSSGEPLPGVTVIIKGTTQGAVTDFDGDYTITDVPGDATLVFSFVGMKAQEIPIFGKTSINVILAEDAIGVEEVVVVGYGTQKKINVTGSVSTVSSEELEERPVSSVAQALQGVVPNLQINTTDGGRPGSDLSWQIRGTGSIGGANDSPLILIDGIPGDASMLNPDDIENISVLKDASASSIYGSRAPYGVVIITTKKGKSQDMKVTLNSWISMRKQTNKLNPMNTLEFMDYYNESSANLGLAPVFTTSEIDSVKYNIVHPEDYKPHLRNRTDPTRWWRGISPGTDFWGETYKNSAMVQNYNMTASGGSKSTRYYASLGYLDQDGLYRYGNDYYKRYTGLLNLNVDATKWLELGLKIQIARENKDAPNSPNLQRDAVRSWPSYSIVDANGHWSNQGATLHIAEEGGRISNIKDAFNNTFSFVIKPFNGFKLNGDATFNSNDTRFTKNSKILYYYNALNEIYGTQSGANQSDIEKQYSMNKFYSINTYANYTKQIKGHYLYFLAGYQQEYNHWYRLNGYRNNLLSEDVLSLNTATGTDISTGDGEYEWATKGYFGRINYNYKEKYLLEINARYDGSSRFPTDLRWGFFPSASVGYNIAKESFFTPLNTVVDMMKFRASYGLLGNANVANYYHSSMTKSQTDYIDSSTGVFLDYVTAPGFGNYGLTWEKPTSLNVGLDLGMFRNRLQMNFDWYRRVTKDMIGPSEPLPAVLGATVSKTNNTELRGTGWEVSLAYKGDIRNFNYRLNFNMAHHKEEVTKYYNPKGLFTTYYEGMVLGEIWGFETVGIIQDEETLNTMADQSELYSKWDLGYIQYKDQDDDEKISRGSQTLDDPGDYIIIGNSTPDFAYNFSLAFDYKGFDMRAFFTGLGHTDWWPSSGQGDWNEGTDELFFGNSNNLWGHGNLKDHLDHWSPENHDAYYPIALAANGNRARGNKEVQTRYLQNRAYLRLKNLQLGYSLKKQWLQSSFIQDARIYISSENLFTITNLRIYDPETPGISYPLQKAYSAGIKLTF